MYKTKEKRNEWQRKNYATNREKCRAIGRAYENQPEYVAKRIGRQLQKRYNITLPYKIQLFKNQVNCCAICGKEFKNFNDGCIDHDHKNGKIRDLLCRKCNTVLGLVDENIEILQKAIKYIDKWNHTTVCPMGDTDRMTVTISND
jgi:hypothetical protein